MKHYELMFIIPGIVEAGATPALIERARSVLTEAGGTVTSEYNMDRRRLAYPIQQQTHGYYYVVQFDVEPTAVQPIDKSLQLDNDILRHIIVEANPMTTDTMRDMVMSGEPKVVAPEAARPVTDSTTNAMYAAAPTPARPSEDTSTDDKGKVSIEELDKKLDAILDDSDLQAKL